MFKSYNKIYWLLMMVLMFSCVDDSKFDVPEFNCNNNLKSNLSIAELVSVYDGETIQIQEDWIIEGYVISSDVAGNFFNVLHFQDNLDNPLKGLQIEIELRDSHLFFEVGQHIYIKLKGLYLGKSRGVYKIGGVFTSFGNKSVGRLPRTVVFDHIHLSCESQDNIVPKTITIDELSKDLVNTLVKIDNLEFEETQLGQTFAEPQEETEKVLVDCADNGLILLNSGFSDFQEEILPNERGSITAVVNADNDELYLIIRDLPDLDFNLDRCEDVITEFTSNKIFITEIADPNNNAGARFVEIYNSSSASISLNGWQLQRFTNANTAVSSAVDLSSYEIQAGGFLIISPNPSEFELVYGFEPDVGVGTNSPADSNGDDNLALLDPFDRVVDIFGVIGEDGTGTNHEFEDGRAVRRIEINEANPNFNIAEWQVYNDSGGGSTLNLPQNAPEDFTPRIR